MIITACRHAKRIKVHWPPNNTLQTRPTTTAHPDTRAYQQHMHEPATHATRSVEVWAGMEVCEELHGNVVQFSSVSKGEKLHCEMVKFVTSPLFLSERMKYNKLSFAQISTRGYFDRPASRT